jgi:hypothetical protein
LMTWLLWAKMLVMSWRWRLTLASFIGCIEKNNPQRALSIAHSLSYARALYQILSNPIQICSLYCLFF